MSDYGWPARREHQVTHQTPTNPPGIDPDAIIDATIWLGILLIALLAAWNINGCLALYESAGPKYAGENPWCA